MKSRTITAAWVLLMVTASLRCPWEWKAALAQMSVAADYREARQALPLGMPIPGCENESGCICRGATLAHGVDATFLSTWKANLLVVGLSTSLPTTAIIDIDCLGLRFSGADRWGLFPLAPRSGRQLRALYGSLLI